MSLKSIFVLTIAIIIVTCLTVFNLIANLMSCIRPPPKITNYIICVVKFNEWLARIWTFLKQTVASISIQWIFWSGFEKGKNSVLLIFSYVFSICLYFSIRFLFFDTNFLFRVDGESPLYLIVFLLQNGKTILRKESIILLSQIHMK